MFERIPVEIDPAIFRGRRNNTLLTRSEIVGFGCLKAGRIKIIEGAASVHPSVLATTAVVEIHNHLELQGKQPQRPMSPLALFFNDVDPEL